MAANDVVNSLVSGGVGAAIASILSAAINSWSKKGESRANAADLVTSAAGGLVDRLEKENARLNDTNKKLRECVLDLTDIIDDLIPLATRGKGEEMDLLIKVREVNRKAKLLV